MIDVDSSSDEDTEVHEDTIVNSHTHTHAQIIIKYVQKIINIVNKNIHVLRNIITPTGRMEG